MFLQEEYPQSEIVIMGHSYGAGMATYLASVRKCKTLVLAAAIEIFLICIIK